MISEFNTVYANDLDAQRERYAFLTENFMNFFSVEDKEGLEYFSAPGRSEIGGNHTDHQHGRVLAAAVNLDIIACAKKRDDSMIRLKSHEYTKFDEIDISVLEPKSMEREKSASLIRGIAARINDLGYNVGGFDCYTTSNVLKGSGLSSSAAFEVLVVTIINHFYNDDKIDPVTVAQIAQYAENVFFGKPSGLMDQTASSVGGFTAIDFNDPKKPVLEKIDFNPADFGHRLCIVDTKGSHADLTNEYAAVPLEMRAVAAFFDKDVLREVDEEAFYRAIPALRERVGDRAVLRAIHFFDENRRAKEEAEKLKENDFEAFRELVMESGRSSLMKLQNVFASSDPFNQGLTLALALTEKVLGKRGAYRVHGGGFAGTIQAYVPEDLLEKYKSEMESVFGEGACYVLDVRSAGGTKIILD